MPPKINSTQHICKICTKVIKYKNLIQCTSCNDCFHSRCVGISFAKAYNAAGNKYTCSPCSNKLGVRVGCNSSNSDFDDGAKKKASSLGSDFGNDSIAICGNIVEKHIQRFLNDIQSKVESQFEKVKSIVEDCLSDMKNEVHKICKQTPNIDDKLSDLNERIAKLEEKMKIFTQQLLEDVIAELNKDNEEN